MVRASFKPIFLLLVIAFFIVGHLPISSAAESKQSSKKVPAACLKTFYIFNIRASVTKAAEYKVNICENKIVSKRYRLHSHPYYPCMEPHGKKIILAERCMDEGIRILQKLKQYYGTNCSNNECFGFITSWALRVDNAKSMLRKIGNTGIKVKLLPQDETNTLSFYALEGHLAEHLKGGNVKLNDIIVWDIGDENFQLSWLDTEDGQPICRHYLSPYGMDNFAELLLYTFNKHHNNKNIFAGDTFFGKATIDDVMAFAVRYAAQSLSSSSSLKQKMKQKNLFLLSTGEFVQEGLKDAIGFGSETVTIEEVKNHIHSFCGLTLEQARAIYPKLPEEHLFSAQSTLIFLYAVMKNLGIESVYFFNYHNIILDYLALHRDYW